MENNEIHSLLMTMNGYLKHCDMIIEENKMWREKHANDQFYSKKEKRDFINLPAECFNGKTTLEVYRAYVKKADS